MRPYATKVNEAESVELCSATGTMPAIAKGADTLLETMSMLKTAADSGLTAKNISTRMVPEKNTAQCLRLKAVSGTLATRLYG